jgi:hypothetical protein
LNGNISHATNRIALATKAFDSIVDGGNTIQLFLNLATMNNSESIEDLLHSFSPYLSDKVLDAFMDRKAVVTPGTYKAILIENSPLDAKLIGRINELGLPDSILVQIKAAQVGTSVREKAKGDVYYWSNELLYWQAEKIRYFLRDTMNGTAFDTLRYLIAANQANDCYVAYAAGLDGNITAMDSAMSRLPNCVIEAREFGSTGKQLREMAKVCIAIDVLLGDTTHEEAYDTLPACFAKAQGLYELFMNWSMKECQYKPESAAFKMEEAVPFASIPVTHDFKLYPNPAYDVITVEFEGEEGHHYLLRITDIAGRPLMEAELKASVPNRILLKQQLSGIYIFQLWKDELPWRTGKLVVN